MKAISILLLSALLFLAAACSSEKDEIDTRPSSKEPLLSAQKQAIEKAKGVEVLLQNTVDKQKLVIDEQAR